MKSLKYAAALLCAALATSTFASAQTSNSALAEPQIMKQVSASDVSAMMAELGIATQLVTPEGSSFPVLVAATPGEGRFLFRFRGCEDEAAAVSCSSAVVTAALPQNGATYDDLNMFNGAAVVTTAVNVEGEPVILFGRNIIVLGGHARDLFKGTVYLFLRDVQQFAETAASTSSVAFRPLNKKSSKVSGFRTQPIAEASRTYFGLTDITEEISAAIANTKDVSFAIEYDGPGSN